MEGGLGVDEGAVARGLAARSCEPFVPPGPEPVPEPEPEPELVPVAPSSFPVDAPRELEERFEPGFPESGDAQGLEVPPSSACFLLYD